MSLLSYKYLLDKDNISPRMRVWIGDANARVQIRREKKEDAFLKTALEHAVTLEDVFLGSMLRGDVTGHNVLDANKLIKSLGDKNAVDWVRILLAREDAANFIGDARQMFNEITKGGGLSDREGRGRQLFETGEARLKRIEALIVPQSETVGVGGPRETRRF